MRKADKERESLLKGNSLLHEASKNALCEDVQNILRDNPELLDAQNDDGETPLILLLKNYPSSDSEITEKYEKTLIYYLMQVQI